MFLIIKKTTIKSGDKELDYQMKSKSFFLYAFYIRLRKQMFWKIIQNSKRWAETNTIKVHK